MQRPSNEPHPPTAPRPSSTPATITNPAAASPVKQKHAVSGDDDVASSNIERDRALLDEKERELLKQREDMLKTSEDQWKMNKEQVSTCTSSKLLACTRFTEIMVNDKYTKCSLMYC